MKNFRTKRYALAALIAAVCVTASGCGTTNTPDVTTDNTTTAAQSTGEDSAAGTESDSGNGTESQTEQTDDGSSGGAVTEIAYQAPEKIDDTDLAIAHLKEKIPNYGAFLEKRRGIPQTYICRIGDTVYETYIKDEHTMALFSKKDDGTLNRVLYTPDAAYEFDTENKIAYSATLIPALIEAQVKANLMNISYSDTTIYGYYTLPREYNGKEYTREAIVSGGEDITEIYSDTQTGEVAYIVSGDYVTEIIEIKNEVTDDSVFEVPADYKTEDYFEHQEQLNAELEEISAEQAEKEKITDI